MKKRKTISKKTRFEVFKRDGFKCQYCGACAPDVLLHIDHIQPISKDGDDDMMNYITSCEPCNLGKGARELSDDTAVAKQRNQLQALQERRDQIEMMLEWRNGLKDALEDEVEALIKAWRDVFGPDRNLTDTGRREARTMLKKFGLKSVLEATDVAHQQYLRYGADGRPTPESIELAWRKLGGVCALAAMPAATRRLYYIKGILNRRLPYVPYDVIEDLKLALDHGAPVEELEAKAKYCSTWAEFRTWLYGL